MRKTLILLGIALALLFVAFPRPVAATGTGNLSVETTSSYYVYVAAWSNAGQAYAFIYPQPLYAKSGLPGQGFGADNYLFVWVPDTAASDVVSVNLQVNALLDNGNQVGLGFGPIATITLSNGFVLIYGLGTEYDWADSAHPVSFAVNALEIVYVNNSNSTITTTVSVSDVMHSIITVESIDFKNFTSVSSDAYAALVMPFPTSTINLHNAFTLAGKAYLLTNDTHVADYNIDVLWGGIDINGTGTGLGIYKILAQNTAFTISETGGAFLIAPVAQPAISVIATDALSHTTITSLSLVINDVTYPSSANVPQGTYTVTVTAAGFEASSFVVTLTESTQTFSTSVSLFPTTAIFSVNYYGAILGYEMGVYSEIITLSPRSSYTNNVKLVFVAWPFQPTVIENGTRIPLTGNEVIIGSVASERVITVVVSATATTIANAQIEIVANDAFTSTASMTIVEKFAIKALPFSLTTPNIWVLGGNVIRVQNDTKTLVTFAVRVVNDNTEIYNKITSLTPLQVLNLTAQLGEGTNTIIVTFAEVNSNLLTGTRTDVNTITFYAVAQKQAEVAATTATVTYDEVNTFTVTVTNPFAVVGTYTVFVSGNWASEAASKVVAILPNQTQTVLVFAKGPINKEISAYEVSFWVVYNSATVFSTSVPAIATNKPALIPAFGDNSDLIFVVVGAIVLVLLVIAIRKEGDGL